MRLIKVEEERTRALPRLEETRDKTRLPSGPLLKSQFRPVGNGSKYSLDGVCFSLPASLDRSRTYVRSSSVLLSLSSLFLPAYSAPFCSGPASQPSSFLSSNHLCYTVRPAFSYVNQVRLLAIRSEWVAMIQTQASLRIVELYSIGYYRRCLK